MQQRIPHSHLQLNEFEKENTEETGFNALVEIILAYYTASKPVALTSR